MRRGRTLAAAAVMLAAASAASAAVQTREFEYRQGDTVLQGLIAWDDAVQGKRPGVLVVESRVPETTVKELRKRGHEVEVGPAWSEGRLTAASRVGKRRRAAANPRGLQGYAAGR